MSGSTLQWIAFLILLSIILVVGFGSFGGTP